MTREEAVTVLKELMKNPLFSEVHKVAFNIAIHDIKQRHEWDINNLILINKDNHESLKQEPKIGHWIPTYGNVKCSVCGSVKDSREVGRATHYCDFCGAKMESEE